MPTAFRFSLTGFFLASILGALGNANPLHAQRPAPPKAAPKLPPPKAVELITKDGVKLNLAYYASPLKEEGGVVVLLHMFKGSQVDFKSLPILLQRDGYAVVVPDLRGHGKSTTVVRGDREGTIDASAMKRAADFEPLIVEDMEAIRKFLIEKNNNKELNCRKTCLVGAEMSAVVALNYAILDWSYPPLTTGPQGQDVKALILITPPWTFKGLTIKAALDQKDILSNLSFLIINGETDSAHAAGAKRLHQWLERISPTPAKDAAERQKVFARMPKTSLQGTKMLGVAGVSIEKDILQFLKLRIANRTIPWAERKSPGE